MRGKGFADGVLMPLCGITPAYAGKSCITYLGLPEGRDHPRLCGEKPSPYLYCTRERRITPAYAGKSKYIHLKTMHFQDHPRLCGEKLNGTNGAECVIGSPPPMRGKVHGSPACTCGTGITPAYAGKSFDTNDAEVQRRDHPRLCGEKNTPDLFL